MPLQKFDVFLARLAGLALVFATANAAVAFDPVQVTNDGWTNYQPSLIERQDGSLMIAYERLDASFANGDILITDSADGTVWSSPWMAIGVAGNQRHPALIQLADGSYLLFYLSNETGGYKLHRAESPDGVSWTPTGPLALGWAAQSQVNPTVCLEDDGSLTLSYDVLSNGGYVAHSVDDGLTWDQDRVRISTGGALYRIMRHSSGMYVASYQRRSGEQASMIDIFTRTSPDRVTWSAETQVTHTLNSHDSFPLELADGTFGLHFITSLGGQPYDLYSQASTDGVTWGNERHWFPDSGWDFEPHPILLSSGTVALAWSRGPTQLGVQIWFVRDDPVVSAPDADGVARARGLRIWPSAGRGPFRIERTDTFMPRRSSLAETRGESDGVDHNLRVFDAAGRIVRVLHLERPSIPWVWDGKDNNGRPVPGGLYLVRTDGAVPEGRIVVVR